MPKKVVLVGHCGPDASYLRTAVSRAYTGVTVAMADDEADLRKALENGGVDLVLMNRQLDWGFETEEGVDLIRQLRTKHPDLKMMLVSNFPEAQKEAVDAGAIQGFGKREIGSPRVSELLKSALA